MNILLTTVVGGGGGRNLSLARCSPEDDEKPKSNPTTGDVRGSADPPDTTRVWWSDMPMMARGWILTMRCRGTSEDGDDDDDDDDGAAAMPTSGGGAVDGGGGGGGRGE